MPIIPAFDPSTGASGGPAPVGPPPPPPGIPTWLDIPSRVHLIQTVPSPDPSEYEWNAPTNGTAPYTYEVTVMGSQPNAAGWYTYDYDNRKIISTRPAGIGTDNTPALLFRIRAYDADGNWGDGHVLLMYSFATGQTVLDEQVLEESDPAVSFTFPPHAGTWVGTNSNSPWSHLVGSGDCYPSAMKGTTTARYQGPFTVDPSPGSVIFMNTVQKNPSSSDTRYIVKAFRRKRADNMTSLNAPYRAVIDYDWTDIGTQIPYTWPPQPSGLTSNTFSWAEPGIGTDASTFTNQTAVTGAASVEQATLDSTGFGLRIENPTSSARQQLLRCELRLMTSHNTPNTAPLGIRNAMIGASDEVVLRVVGTFSWSGTASQVGIAFGGANSGAVRVQFRQGGAIGGAPATNVAFIEINNGSSMRTIGVARASEVKDVPIGIDFYLRGTSFTSVVYVYGGSLPDLNEQNPYANLRRWTAEGSAESAQNLYVSMLCPSNIYATTSGFGQTYMRLPIFEIRTVLGNSGASVAGAKITQLIVAHRAGRQLRPY